MQSESHSLIRVLASSLPIATRSGLPLGVLFQLEDTFGLTPDEDGTLSIDPKADGAQKMVQAIRAWHNAKEELERGEMSEDDYKSWKSSFRM